MKKYAVMLAALFALGAAAGELTIYGDFPEPRKPGQPPKNWNKTSGAQGSLEFIAAESGNAVMLTADEKKNFGIYSQPSAAKAGDKIKVTAKVRGSGIIFAIFQYSGKSGSSAQRKVLKSTAEGKDLEAVFTVADTPKGATDRIRVCFLVENGASASITDAKAFLLEE